MRRQEASQSAHPTCRPLRHGNEIAIGKRLMLSPAFPPLHTERATFTALRVPSVLFISFLLSVSLYSDMTDLNDINNNDLRPFLLPHYRAFIGSTSAFQHRFSGLSSSSTYLQDGDSIPFLVPMILSITYTPLGVCSGPASLERPAAFRLRRTWTFIKTILTHPH